MNPRRFILLLLLLSAPAAPAAEFDDLYVGEAPVADQSAEARAEALEAALGQVLVRVTGDPAVLEDEYAADLLRRASDWVQSYGYAPAEEKETSDDEEAADGEATAVFADKAFVEPDATAQGADAAGAKEEEDQDPGLVLRARFDDAAVQRALRAAGLPVWGRERPRTLVFLAVEGEADIVSAQTAEELAAAMRETAKRRGVPLAFPLRDDAERRELRTADIRYGKLENALAAAKRYGASHVLVGRIEEVGDAWRGEWRLSHRGETMAEWDVAAAERDRVLSDATGRLADLYARRFAVYGGVEADTVVAVAVDGVTAVEDYAHVGRYLRGLTLVESVAPILIDREAVVFRVQLSGGAGALARGIDLADWLREDELARNLAGLYAAEGRALGYRIGF